MIRTPAAINATPAYCFQVNGVFCAPMRPKASIKAATSNCDNRMVEMATVGERSLMDSMTVMVMTGAMTPPSQEYHGDELSYRMLPLPNMNAITSDSANPTS